MDKLKQMLQRVASVVAFVLGSAITGVPILATLVAVSIKMRILEPHIIHWDNFCVPGHPMGGVYIQSWRLGPILVSNNVMIIIAAVLALVWCRIYWRFFHD